jgi:hypothetical protein
MHTTRARLMAANPGLPAAHDEREALDESEGELRRAVRELCDQLVERDVIAPPAWARATFGERPAGVRAAEQWDRGVRAIGRFRVEHGVADDVLGLGPEPRERGARGAWRQADVAVREVQERLGRGVDHGRDQDRGAGLVR